jgi:hypothetical protein
VSARKQSQFLKAFYLFNCITDAYSLLRSTGRAGHSENIARQKRRNCELLQDMNQQAVQIEFLLLFAPFETDTRVICIIFNMPATIV